MLTLKKLAIYEKYDGKIDAWARTGSKAELLEMEDADWFLIDQLLQDLALVNKGLTSAEYSDSIHEKVRLSSLDAKVVETLMSMIEQEPTNKRGTCWVKLTNFIKRKMH